MNHPRPGNNSQPTYWRHCEHCIPDGECGATVEGHHNSRKPLTLLRERCRSSAVHYADYGIWSLHTPHVMPSLS